MLHLGLYAAASSGDGKAEKVSRPDINQSYLYDRSAGEFLFVPSSPSGVDSLLVISYNERNKNPQKAAYAAFQAQNMAEEMDYDEGLAQAHATLGELFEMFMDYSQALNQYQSALEIELRLKREVRAGKLLNQIGTIHTRQKNFREATKFFLESIEMMHKNSNTLTMAEALTALGLNHHQIGNYREALRYFDQVQGMEGDSEDLQKIKMTSVMNAGTTYLELLEYHEAESHLNQAIHYFRQHEHIVDLSKGHLYLANLYLKWNKSEDALVQAQKSKELAESIEDHSLVMEAYRLLSEIYEGQNNSGQALLNFKLYHDLHNHILNNAREARLTQRQIQNDVARKNREIWVLNQRTALQEAELTNRELWQKLMLAGLGFTIVITMMLWRNIHIKKSAHQVLQLKQSEIERQNRQLTYLNQEKDDFLEMAAHDLRNPLSAIKGVVELMEDEIKSNAAALELTGLIKISTERMLGLVNNFLNVDVKDAVSGNFRVLPVHINKPIKRVVGDFHKKALDKHIKVVLNLGCDMKPVLADEEVFERILENLISNAIKFSQPGTTVEISSLIKQDHVEISVRDNGPGITGDDQKKMFMRYGTLSNKPTANEPSTGLGLYIVKKFTEAMGGQVSCDSKPGEGTIFTVSLPLESAPATYR
ncbi:MAG: ATP-binding protein [Balneolales bacterium]